MDRGNSCPDSGVRDSPGARVIDRPEGEHDSDNRRQADGGIIADNYPWGADSDSNFPLVKNGMRDETRGRAGLAALKFSVRKHCARSGRASRRNASGRCAGSLRA
jgi:hypothetical protein